MSRFIIVIILLFVFMDSEWLFTGKLRWCVCYMMMKRPTRVRFELCVCVCIYTYNRQDAQAMTSGNHWLLYLLRSRPRVCKSAASNGMTLKFSQYNQRESTLKAILNTNYTKFIAFGPWWKLIVNYIYIIV